MSRCGFITNPDKHIPRDKLPLWLAMPMRARLAFMDSDTGCSMKARLFTHDGSGGMVEFALLPDEVKLRLADNLRNERNMTMLHKNKEGTGYE